MKRALLLIVLVTAVVAPIAGAAGGSTPAAVLKGEVAAGNAGNWKVVYALMSPRFRKLCPFATFAADNEAARQKITKASVVILSTRVIGSRAYLTYKTIAPPIKPFIAKNDLFVKIARRWYDEVDSLTTC